MVGSTVEPTIVRSAFSPGVIVNHFPEDEFPEPGESVERDQEGLREFVYSLPLIPPPDIAERLEHLGYKGQEEPRRALSLLAYRHVRRLKRLYINNENRRTVSLKQNTL